MIIRDVFVKRVSEKAICISAPRLQGAEQWVPKAAIGIRRDDPDALHPLEVRGGQQGTAYLDGWWCQANLAHLPPEAAEAPGAADPLSMATPEAPAGAEAALPLNEGQQAGMEAIFAWLEPLLVARDLHARSKPLPAKTAALVGYAGTGKSWLLQEVRRRLKVEHGLCIGFGTPTGKAASRLRELGLPAETLHRRTFGTVDDDGAGGLRFGDPRSPLDPGQYILVCDEATMIGPDLWPPIREHIPDGKAILLVGDTAQLPPVGKEQDGSDGRWPAELDTPLATLTQVMRQGEGSDVLEACMAIRTGDPLDGVPRGGDFDLRESNVGTMLDWFVERRRVLGGNVTLICWTNAMRNRLNAEVRRMLGRKGPGPEPGDRVLVRRNNYTLNVYNGEVYSVAGVLKSNGAVSLCTLEGVRTPVVLVHELLYADKVAYSRWMKANQPDWVSPKKDAFNSYGEWLVAYVAHRERRANFDRILEANFGECITSHASQGSSWEEVGAVVDPNLRRMAASPVSSDIDTARRIMYVMASRAEKRLVMWNTKESNGA